MNLFKFLPPTFTFLMQQHYIRGKSQYTQTELEMQYSNAGIWSDTLSNPDYSDSVLPWAFTEPRVCIRFQKAEYNCPFPKHKSAPFWDRYDI